MATAFVTGATGQDGSYLVERLLNEGWAVHALVRTGIVDDETAPPTSVRRHRGDLADRESIRRAVETARPDLVVNLGGITSVAQSWDSPADVGTVSGLGAVALMEESLRLQERTTSPVRFIQASSAEIFGASDEVPQRESTPLRPTSPYGAAKAYAHEIAGMLRGRGLAVSCAVLYNHESPRRPSRFVTRKITMGAARIARGLDSELVLGNLDAARDWGWAPDYVDAMVRMVSAPADDFVIATGEVHTVRDFAIAALRAAGVDDGPTRLRADASLLRQGDAPMQVGDATRARERLGWTPTVDFEGIVAAMVDADLARLDSAR